MEQLNLLTLKHANLKDGEVPRPVFIVREMIFGFFYSSAGAATHIIGPGGAIVPVLETVSEVSEKLKQVTKEAK